MQITFMKASVVRSRAAPPKLVATPRSSSAVVQIPCAASPRAAAKVKAARRAAPPDDGSSAAVAGSWPRWRRAAAGSARRERPAAPATVPKPGCTPRGRFGGHLGTPRALGERLLAAVVRRGAAHVTVARDRQLHGHVVDGRRLRRAVVGESQRQRALAGDVGQGVAAHGGDGPLGQRERVHATPTWTSRKRAGAHPCDTRIT
jgi:hypothetical protein